MTGKKPSIYWLICWRYISPIAMVVILAASFVQMAVSGSGINTYNKNIVYSEKNHGVD
jgi:solute carrier family 6 amino acid/orphan transporter-like 15/16/17/18/20